MIRPYLLTYGAAFTQSDTTVLQYLERISDAALSAYLWCCIYATPPSMHTAQTCLARMQYSTVLLLVQKNTVLTFSCSIHFVCNKYCNVNLLLDYF